MVELQEVVRQSGVSPVPQTDRQQEAALVNKLRMERDSPGLWQFRQLLQLRLSRLDKRLRQCPLDEFPALQAQAKTYFELLDEIFVRTA